MITCSRRMQLNMKCQDPYGSQTSKAIVPFRISTTMTNGSTSKGIISLPKSFGGALCSNDDVIIVMTSLLLQSPAKILVGL